MNIISIGLIGLLLLTSLNALGAKCNIKIITDSNNTEAVQFVKDSSMALHLQLIHENFNSKEAHQARSKIFDTVINTPYWNRRFGKANEFKIFWNWIRFQYWGLIQQQALLREDQGFRASQDKGLADKFNMILKYPIYPYPVFDQNHICSARERAVYGCNQKTVRVDVLLSPSLACESKMNKDSFKFTYLVTKSPMGWSIMDIIFKGRNLIFDSFNEYDNLLNKYGSDKALNYLKFMINKVNVAEPNVKPEQNGSLVFNKIFKVTTPKYPLEY